MRAADDALDAPGPIQSGIANRFPAAGRVLHSGAVQAGGKVLGWGGVGVGLVDAFGAYQDEEYVDAGFNTAGAVGGGMLLVAGGPITLALGGALVLGSLAYEYRDGIGDFVDSAGDVAGSVVSGVGDGLSAAGDAISSAGGAIADGIGSVGRGIGDLFG